MVTSFDRFLAQFLGPAVLAQTQPLEGPPVPTGQQAPPSQPPSQPQAPLEGPPAPVQSPLARVGQQAGQGNVQATRRASGPTPPPAKSARPARQGAGEHAYVIFDTPQGEAQVVLPIERTAQMPSNARIVTTFDDPERVQRAKGAGFYYDQLPPELQAQFRTEGEQQIVAEESAAWQQIVGPGQNVPQPPPSTEPTDEDTLAARQQFPATTVADLRASGDPEAARVADLLEQHGISEVPAGQVPVFNGEGQIVLTDGAALIAQQRVAEQQQAETLASQTVGGERDMMRTGEPGIATEQAPPFDPSQMDALTTERIRQMGQEGNNPQFEAVAAELEAQDIFWIGGDQMVVRDGNGRLRLVPASDAAPAGTEIVLYGGASEPRDRRILPVTGDEVIPGFLQPVMPDWAERTVEDVAYAVGDNAPAIRGGLWDVVSGTAQLGTNIGMEDWGDIGGDLRQIGVGAKETGAGLFGLSMGVLNAPAENIGMPLMGAIAGGGEEINQVWSEIESRLPEPVRDIVTAMGEQAPAIIQSGLNATIPGYQLVQEGGGSIENVVTPVGLLIWGAENPDTVNRVYEQGWDMNGDGVADVTGHRAVWEAYQNEQPMVARAVGDIWADPLNWATLGGAGLIRAGARVAGTADTVPLWRWMVGGGLRDTGRALQLPDTLLDGVVLTTLQRLFGTMGSGARRIPWVRNLMELSPRALVTRAEEEIGGPIGGVLGRLTGDAGPQPTTPAGPVSPGPGAGPTPGPAGAAPSPARVAQPADSVGTVEMPPPYQGSTEGRTVEQMAEALWPSPGTSVPQRAVADAPFAGTSLGREPVPEGPLAEKPDWDFLTPAGAEEREGAARLIDAVWDAREQHPDRWRAFAAEYGPLAERFRDTQRAPAGRRRAGTVREARAHEAVEEARHVVTELLPAIERHFGDVLETPAYRPRYGPDATPTNVEVQIERAIFDPDPEMAENYMATLRGEMYVVKRSNGEVEFRRRASLNPGRPSDEIVRQVETLRNRYRGTAQAAQPAVEQASPVLRQTPQAVVQAAPLRLAAQPVPEAAAQPSLFTERPAPTRRQPVAQTPEVPQAPQSMAPASGYFAADPGTIRTDPARFQPREGLNARRVAELAENFDPNRAEAVIAWRDPADGQLYILSGHHRLAAAQQAGVDRIDVRLFEGTENEARALAAGGNLGRTSQRPMEQFRSYEMRREAGVPEREAREGIDNFTKIEQASHLTPNLRRALDASYGPDEAMREGLPALSLGKAARLGRSVKAGLMAPEAAEAFWQRNPRLHEMSDRRFTALMNKLDNLAELNRAGIAGQGQGATLFDLNTVARDDYSDLLATVDQKGAEITRLKGQMRKIQDSQRLLRESGRGESRGLRELEREFNADLARLNDEIQGAVAGPNVTPLAERRPGSQVADLAARGATPADLAADTRTVYGQTLGRQVGNPTARRVVAETQARRAATFADADEPVVEWRGRVLEGEELTAFNRRFEDADGNALETVRERLDRYIADIEAEGEITDIAKIEGEAAKRVINDWAIQALRGNTKAFAKYESLLAKYAKQLPDDLAPEATAQTRALGQAISPEQIPVYDTALSVLREMALYNTLSGPRYVLTQVVGNAVTAMLSGNPRVIFAALTPANLRQAYADLQNAPAGVLREHGGRGVYERLKIVEPATDAVVKDEVTLRGNDLRMHSVTDRAFNWGRTRLPSGQAHGGFRFSSIFANKHIRDWANATDLAYRRALGEHVLRTNAAIGRRDFRAHVLDRLPRHIDGDRVEEVFERLPADGLFSSDDVRFLFRELGDDRWADRMARDWQTGINRWKKLATDEVNRVFFTGDEYNADRLARRIIFFHYWMSRAAPLYTSSLMKHAGVLHAYLNMMQEMQESASEFGPAAEGFVKFFSTPMGYNIFIRPDAMVQVFAQFWDDAGFAPDGENWLGKFMRSAGVMFNPLVATVANLSGVQGDTFAADPLMLGKWSRLVQQGITYARTQGWVTGEKPAGNVYNDIWTWVRDYTTDVTEEVIPGVEHIEYKDSAVYAQRELNYLIMDVAEEMGYERDGIEARTAMNNPDSPLYQEAFSRMAEQGMLDNAIRYASPWAVLYPKSRVASKDQLNLDINALPEGSEERERLMDMRAAANTVDPRATELRNETGAYFAIGGEEGAQAYATYNGIRYGDLDAPVTIGGREVTPEQVAGMDELGRQRLADQWAEETGNGETIGQIREERGAMLDAGGSYADYRAWQETVRDYPGGPDKWWRDTAAVNDNAARFYEEYKTTYDGPVKDYEAGLTGQSAYMAVQGIQRTYSDPAPISTNNGTGPAMASQPQTEGGFDSGPREPTVASITEDLQTYEARVAEYNGIVSEMMGQPVDIANVNPMLRDALVMQVRDHYGVDPPYLSGAAADYLRWAGQQGDGPTDIASYLEWRRRTRGAGQNYAPPGQLPQLSFAGGS